MAPVHWWPQRTTNSRCHQQLRPHNTKHKHTNQSAKHCTIIRPLTHHNHNQHITYDMTIYYKKTKGHSPTTRKLTGHNLRKTQFAFAQTKLLNEEITSCIQKHKENIWKEHLDAHWAHRHNTHILWKVIHGLSNRAPPTTLNKSITFNNKIATHPNILRIVSPNNSQTLSNMQHTK